MSERLTLVTGATGFLGATLVQQLVDAGEAVRILRRSSSLLDLLGDAANAIEHALGDVTDFASVRAAMDDITHVYHAAAFIGFGGKNEAERLMQVNVGGTANVADAAREAGVERLVHVSSIAALGRTLHPQGVIDETAVWRSSKANTAYAVSKHRAEMEVQRAIAEGLDAVLVNPALIFGPGRSGENTLEIAEKLRDGTLPASASGGTCVVDVADVAAGMQAAMAWGTTGERYLLGGENLPWTTILNTLADALGVAPPRYTLP
ncbi:MAG: NAD-dependent epimerase/dehydratase family protein, partial [Rhodothermaceae bacterium]|nr:NAD-dependent epimerase/dehydratase family protein [Rhodothermaceae bacterium]